MKIKDISVIIVCRNGKKVTQECLHGLLQLPIKEVIVVDNNSTDGTNQLLNTLKRKDSRLSIIRNEKNNGFAEANNQGFRLATGAYVLFLNNDTVVESDIFPPLLKTLSSRKVAAVQPMILFPDYTIDSVGSYLTPTGFLYHRAHRMKPDISFLKQEAVYTLKGACMLWKRSVLEEIGVFKESYFAYFEETELCHRAINAGYELMVNPHSQIIHLGGFTSNHMDQKFIQFHNAKNRVITYLIHFPLRELLMIFPFHLLLTELQVLKTLINNGVVGLAIQKGVCLGIINGIHLRMSMKAQKRYPLRQYTKHPDFSYYKALFSSLIGYNKVF